MAERPFARPFIPLFLSLGGGVAIGARLPGHAPWAAALAAACLAMVFYWIRHGRWALVTAILLFLSLGYLSIQPWLSPRFNPRHIVRFAGDSRYEISGVVASEPLIGSHRVKFILKAERLKKSETTWPVNGKIRVTVAGSRVEAAPGDRVRFISRIRKIRNFNNPGGFDYKRAMAFRRIWVSAYTATDRLQVDHKYEGRDQRLTIAAFRRKIARVIDTGAGQPAQQILRALVIGDRNGISAELRQQFTRAGVAHLLAISGLHIGIVATVSFFFFQWLLCRFRFLLWQAWTRKGAALLTMIPVLIYGQLAGFSPSTQRAVIMVLVFLTTFLLDRQQDLINTIAVAAFIILAIHPPSLFSISFQLSFAAVTAIIYGLSRFGSTAAGRLAERGKFAAKFLSFVLVSALAQLGTLPLTMLYFNQISLIGLAANIIAVPLIGFGVVPLGLLAAFFSLFSMDLSLVLIKVADIILSPTMAVLGALADLPFAAVKTITPSLVETTCYYALLWAVLNQFGHDKANGTRSCLAHSRGRFWPSWLAATRTPSAGVIVLALAVGAADAGYWVYARFIRDELRVTIIDVGQGSAALVEAPRGRVVMIDGGGFTDNSAFDVGERIIAPLLWRKKIVTVDLMVLSHPNSDHLNGLIYVARHFEVKQVLTNDEKVDTDAYRAFSGVILEKNIHRPQFRGLARRVELNGARLEILYPPPDFLQKKKRERWRHVNNNSLVVKVVFGAVSFLFPGDIHARVERALVNSAAGKLASTVLMAPHHGSKTSNSAIFLDRVDPRWVVVSNGWHRRRHFPHKSVLKRCRLRGVRLLRTAQHGAVTMVTDGRSLRVEPTLD